MTDIQVQPPPLSRNSSSPSNQPPRLRPNPRPRIEPFLYITKTHAISSERAFLVIRSITLFVSLSCLILDIVTLSFSISHEYRLPFDRLVIPKGSYVVFVLIPDIAVVSLMSILLWERIRLPLRLWTIHVFFRVLSSLALAAIGLVYSLREIEFFANRKNGVEKYFCQGFYPPTWKSEHSNNNVVDNQAGLEDIGEAASRGGDDNRVDGNGNGIAKILMSLQESQYQSLSLEQQSQSAVGVNNPEYIDHCRVMRSRSMIAFLWAFLLLLELYIAYLSCEFKRPEWDGESGWTPQGSGLNKWAYDSTSEIWENAEEHQPSNQRQIDTRHSVLGSKQSSDISLEYLTDIPAHDGTHNNNNNNNNNNSRDDNQLDIISIH